MEKTTQKERRTGRRRALKAAQITFKGLKGLGATIDCTIRDISESGACLKVESPVGIPDDFVLAVGGVPTHRCRLLWRKASQIGVEFI
jgi:PilZ domain